MRESGLTSRNSTISTTSGRRRRGHGRASALRPQKAPPAARASGSQDRGAVVPARRHVYLDRHAAGGHAHEKRHHVVLRWLALTWQVESHQMQWLWHRCCHQWWRAVGVWIWLSTLLVHDCGGCRSLGAFCRSQPVPVCAQGSH